MALLNLLTDLLLRALAFIGGLFITVLRFLGALFLLAAVIALTADMTRAGPALAFTSLLKHWSDFAPQTLDLARKWVHVRTHPFLWDPLIRSILSVPAWISLGVLGSIAAYLGRPRRRIEIFVN